METNSALDILKTAILLEKRGKAFYETVAAKTDDLEVRKIFSIMASEEQLHIEFLSQHYVNFESNGNFQKGGIKPMADESIAGMVLSQDITKRISAAGFEAAAISAAIDMENKAIEVYSKRASESNDAVERELFDFLANWERSHHKILHTLNEELKEKIWHDNQFWPF